MKFRQKFMVSLLLFTALSVTAYAQVVHIPDPNLRSAIRESLNLPSGVPLTRAAIRSLTSLDAGDRGIVDLTGLEHATELTLLIIPRNQISDLAPIAALTKLEFLAIADNPISDITPLSNLEKLRRFDASGCRISDINPLANLTQLTRIDLRHNAITDIQPLADLVRLEQLALNGNRITDVSPLAGLSRLKTLGIQDNLIADHSPVDTLSLDRFVYDETCDMPPLPLESRLENRTFPSVVSAWGDAWSSSVLNRSHLSGLEQMSQHDLYFSGPMFFQRFFDTGDGWELRGVLERSEQIRDDYIAFNPNMVFLVEIRMRDAQLEHFPEDSPYWLRDANGETVIDGQGLYLINFTHPEVQEIIVEQAIAVSKCGLYDGVFFDWWNEGWHVLGGKYVTLEAEQRARDNILQRIRAETRPDFLIMGNTNRDKIPRTGKHINGSFMETLIPRGLTGDRLEALLTEVENSLLWLDTNLREPRINALKGAGVPTESPDSPTNLRWMRAFTTLSLTHSDGYVLFNDGIGHSHYWYDFWDADLSHPVGDTGQLYQETDGLYIREFTNGWAVYNHSGAQQVMTLPEEVQGVASGWVGTEHVLPNLDGEMYLRVKPKNPADVNGDGAVNILDLTLVAQEFGTNKTDADVNGDGVVNVFDLIFVANQF
ncbi:MAG: leucine-rich repeat domain-containing protein [Candidatus Poribacteria bacterium]|nr:leucine-rich repeat domain-containing protein [Candidatus Poribacteria bacterium]